nr:farnesyl diphosphate synthase [Ipomoea batatas]
MHSVLSSTEQSLFSSFGVHWSELEKLPRLVCEMASQNGTAADPRSEFVGVYAKLKSELLNDSAFQFTPDSRQWVQRMLEYNVPGGKLNRGLSVIDSYKLLKEGKEIAGNEIFLASVLGWCIEWLQAYFLILDDIMDNSHTRRGQPCWFRVPKVGIIAINDGILLRNHIPRILKNHFKDKPYYVDLLDLFNEVEFQTTCGQMIDLITTIEGEKDLSKYSLPLHQRIVQYKTAYYSFYLPVSRVQSYFKPFLILKADVSSLASYFTSLSISQVACALLMVGEKLENHVDVKSILIDMGIYFQVQDDYLDCFGDPEKIGKIGTDIEDFKCSWLVAKALEHCNEEQKKTLYEHYGKQDPASVAQVKAIYNELNLQGVFNEYESKIYEKLASSIEAHPSKAMQAVLKSFLGKIYKRLK